MTFTAAQLMIDLHPYVRYAASRAHPQLVAWQGSERIEELLHAGLASTLARSEDPKALARFHDCCPIAGAESNDYRIRELTVAGVQVLASIHFYGLDVTRPFVEVDAQTAALPAERSEEWIGDLVRELAVFAPGEVRVQDRWQDELPPSTGDRHVVAGQLGELRRRPPPGSRETLVLEPASPSCHGDLVATYEEFYRDYPDTRTWLNVATEQELVDCADRGVLLTAHVGGDHAGFIAALREDMGEVGGWVVVEEVLRSEFRGRGLGPVLQRGLIDRLPGNDHELLFGTIHVGNERSLRTAIRCGRQIVSSTSFVRA